MVACPSYLLHSRLYICVYASILCPIQRFPLISKIDIVRDWGDVHLIAPAGFLIAKLICPNFLEPMAIFARFALN